MKIANLILSILLFVFVSVSITHTQTAQANEPREASFSFELPERSLAFSKEANSTNGNGTITTKVMVYNVKVNLETDNNANEFYSKVTWFIDVDAEEPVNVYVRIWAKNEGDWNYWTGPGLLSDTFTLMGDDPDEGVFSSSWFYMGYDNIKTERKIEVFYEDGRLACTYGPDDDPDLKDIPAESQEYDVKGDPFANYTPTPTPTPTPNPQIIGHIVDKGDNDISGAKATLKKNGEVIATASSDENGEFVLENLEPGEYNLQVTKKGYRRKSFTVIIEEDGGDEKIVIQMKKQKR